MNNDRSKKTTRKTAPKLLGLLLLGLASIGATGCEHPLSTMFNQQGETARAAMEQQTALMQQILEDQRAREDDLLARLDEAEQGDENEFTEDECLEETGEPCPEEEEVEELEEDETELALGDDDGETDGGGIVLEDNMAD